jgi:hypothetical protein
LAWALLIWYTYYMATKIYESGHVELIDGTEIKLEPLKIKYLREFMDVFGLIEFTKNDSQAIAILTECATVCMKQFYPQIKSREELEDAVDLPTVYKILDLCAGIKINEEKEDIEVQAKQESVEKNSWKDLDLAGLEAEAFLVGAWENFEALELAITMAELLAIIERGRELDYQEKKFLAAIQGVDLDKHSGKSSNAWEEMKARVFSGGQTDNPNDILSFQGVKAQQNGFGIGMGLSYEKLN